MNEQNPYVDFASVNYKGSGEKAKITADVFDKLLAVFCVAMGYLLVYCAIGFNCSAQFFAAFTVLYVAGVYVYMAAKKKRPAIGSIFWAVALTASGVSFGIYDHTSLWWSSIQLLTTFFIGAYFTSSAAGTLIDGKTSSWIVRDICKTLFCVPFINYVKIFSVLKSSSGKKGSVWRMILYILLGAALSIPILWIIIPLLSSADARMSILAANLFDSFFDNLGVYCFRFVLSIPIFMYIFGLIYGTVNKLGTDKTDKSAVYKSREGLRKVPNAAVNTGMIIICIVYALFIGLQVGSFITVISGNTAAGFSYSQYARQGFFDLCKVSAFNLVVLYLANMFSVTKTKENTLLKLLNFVLSFLTLFLIASAMSKMLLYIGGYGLTIRRLITGLFMLWLAVVFLIIIVRQIKTVKLIRPACIIGAAMYTLVCALPIEYIILCFNTQFGYLK